MSGKYQYLLPVWNCKIKCHIIVIEVSKQKHKEKINFGCYMWKTEEFY